MVLYLYATAYLPPMYVRTTHDAGRRRTTQDDAGRRTQDAGRRTQATNDERRKAMATITFDKDREGVGGGDVWKTRSSTF